MERYIGLDVGYGFVKVTDGESGYAFPSVVGEGDLRPSIGTWSRQVPRVADLRLGLDGDVYFVGKLAIRRSNLAYRALSAMRSEGRDLQVLFLSALSLFCNDSVNRFQVVTGLPPGRMHLVDTLKASIEGRYKVSILKDGIVKEVDIAVDELAVVPQPLGTFWSETLDSWGRTKNEISGPIGIVDVGFKTTDFATIEDGEFIPEKSFTLPVGLSNAYSDLSDNLLIQHGLERESYALDEAFIQGSINVSGRPVDISSLRDNSFENLATKINVELMSAWRVPELDKILISGGGGGALGKHLLRYLPQGEVVADAVTANSLGFYNWANRLWGKDNNRDQ